MQIIEYIDIPEDVFFSCIAQSSDVEILNKIQDLMLETAEYWDNGIPKYSEVNAECEGVEAKKQLLALLMLEYQKRMYKDDPHRMHLCEGYITAYAPLMFHHFQKIMNKQKEWRTGELLNSKVDENGASITVNIHKILEDPDELRKRVLKELEEKGELDKGKLNKARQKWREEHVKSQPKIGEITISPGKVVWNEGDENPDLTQLLLEFSKLWSKEAMEYRKKLKNEKHAEEMVKKSKWWRKLPLNIKDAFEDFNAWLF